MLFGNRDKDDETVVAMLASALRRDIAFGLLPPDQKLKIEGLRQRYGGSNHSMRETLRLLSAEGLVEATTQRGFRVMSATQQDLEDILFMRLEVEKLGLSRSMENATVQWEGTVMAAFHALGHAQRQVQAAPDDVTALEWDDACCTVHKTLVVASRSPRLIDMAAKFYNQSRRFHLALLREGRIDFAVREARQKALCEAVLAGQTTRALALLEEEIRQDLGEQSI
ncbi:GntR family transcriptional regulator [Roseibium limicola]|uniref:GntR family transcriptional regulator n=1 Tax=Roseibium limicola TaxID=2816037 RepID=A0A939JBG9_9HYPH|nr:GntR family transcriptional regulator [Roseibium limicola]MBO0347453.1 GntR family transcriptional regulator [Roseibium limicola]